MWRKECCYIDKLTTIFWLFVQHLDYNLIPVEMRHFFDESITKVHQYHECFDFFLDGMSAAATCCFLCSRLMSFRRRPAGEPESSPSLQLLLSQLGQLLGFPPLQLLLEEEQVDVDDVVQDGGGAEEAAVQRSGDAAAEHILA